MTDPQYDLYCNGIDGATGTYGRRPMTATELADAILGRGRVENPDEQELRARLQARDEKHLGVMDGVDPRRLDQAGWGLVLAHDADPGIQEALKPLLDLRREQAGALFKLYAGGDGYRDGDSKLKFLARPPRGCGPGPVVPRRCPYYLLICGSPARIPFRFQSQLDVQFAAGRLHFDTLDEYANYAANVVAAEAGPPVRSREALLFGVVNQGDRATELSDTQLVQPLCKQLKALPGGWRVEQVLRKEATKARLAAALAGADGPALLFTASHGMGFPLEDQRQAGHQGALLCRDWPGREQHQGPIPPDFYFAADDLAADSDLRGLIAFFFACYGAGTPLLDDFPTPGVVARAQLTPEPFLAALPTRMLGLKKGALAVIGHVDRAWTHSFRWADAGAQTEVFRGTLAQLMAGYPVGAALEFFNERYAELATSLTDLLADIQYGAEVDAYALAGLWTAHNDARGYLLLGDPAVRLTMSSTGVVDPKGPPLWIVP